MTEQWLPIKDFEGIYEVSDLGRVRRLRKHKPPRILSPGRGKYLKVYLSNEPDVRQVSIHRLVLGAFVGACPPVHEAAHLNGDSYDNRLVNLDWVTSKENESHKRIHGTLPLGENTNSCKLSVQKVLEIRYRRGLGQTLKSIADCFLVSESNISEICLRKTWRHI